MIVAEFHEFIESCMILSYIIKRRWSLRFFNNPKKAVTDYSTRGRAGRSGNGFVSIGCYEQSPRSSCFSSIGSTAGLWHETCWSCKTIVGSANGAIWWTWWLWRCQFVHSEDFCLQGRTTDDFMSETMFVFNLATLAIVEMSFLLASVAVRCVYQLPGPPRPPPAPPPPRAPKQDTKGMSRLSPRKRRDRKGKDGEKCVSMWCAQKEPFAKLCPFWMAWFAFHMHSDYDFTDPYFRHMSLLEPFCVFKLPLLLETAHQTNILLQNLELSDALKQN